MTKINDIPNDQLKNLMNSYIENLLNDPQVGMAWIEEFAEDAGLIPARRHSFSYEDNLSPEEEELLNDLNDLFNKNLSKIIDHLAENFEIITSLED